MNCSRILSTSLICVCLFALTIPGWAQTPIHRGVLGQMDPATGTFKPLVPALDEAQAAINTATTIGGTFVIHVAITIKTPALQSSTQPIACTGSASIVDQNNTTFVVSGEFTEEASVQATRSSSTAASCNITIPYSWPLNNASTDTISMSLQISMPGFFTSATNALPNRFHSRSLPTIKVPGNGLTTNIPSSGSIAVTI